VFETSFLKAGGGFQETGFCPFRAWKRRVADLSRRCRKAEYIEPAWGLRVRETFDATTKEDRARSAAQCKGRRAGRSFER